MCLHPCAWCRWQLLSIAAPLTFSQVCACLGESSSSLPKPKPSPWQVPEHSLVEKARATINFMMQSLSTALSTFDIDIPINFLFYGAHTPAAQPTARARAMFTRAFVLHAVLFCAALRRAALAEGWGGSSAADGP